MSSPAWKSWVCALALTGAALLASGATVGAAAQPAPRYATPTPIDGADCSSVAQACDLVKAVANAPSGGEVVVLPGNYTLSGAPLIAPDKTALNIHGLDPHRRPVITSNAPVALEVDDQSSTIADLDLRDTNRAGAALLFRGALADRILARAPGRGGACELALKTTLRDSVCVASNPRTAAVRVYGYGSSTPVTLRNVTAIATDPSGFGVKANQLISGGASFTLTLINTIARVQPLNAGAAITGADISANTNFGPVDVIAQGSSWSTSQAVGSTSSVDVAPGSFKQVQAPKFVDPAHFDYHEAGTSPTIGVVSFATAPDALNGASDLDGDARVFLGTGGNSTDIGADEYVALPPPPTTTTTTTTLPPPTTSTTTSVPTTTPLPPPDTTPPVLTSISIKPSGFAVAAGRRKKRIRYGASVRFSVNEVSGVVATVQQKTSGRQVGRLCKKQTKSNSKKRRCTLWASRGPAFSNTVASGVSAVAFSGKLGSRKLAPGTYRFQLVATDAAQNTSAAKTLQFKIVRG